MKEKCGVFAVWGSRTAAYDIYLGLYALQHRGQEGAGMVVVQKDGRIYAHKGQGWVTRVFEDQPIQNLQGHYGIGHVRYSTSGGVSEKELQPFSLLQKDRLLALAHNGNITNAPKLKQELEEKGIVMDAESDSYLLLRRLAESSQRVAIERIKKSLEGVEGAYSLVVSFEGGIAGIRDPFGFRPLYWGWKYQEGEKIYYIASETCAFDIVKVKEYFEISPGSGVWIDHNGVVPFQLLTDPKEKFCCFEVIYFSRPDSLYKFRSIHKLRTEMGKTLYEENPVDADIVTSIPDSSNSAALGFAQASGIPYEITLIRSHYVGRTFIAPAQKERDIKVRKKFNVVRDMIAGKRIVVVDDSIVRGTTSRQIVELFRKNGASEVHMRIASPPVRFPCYFGIDMPRSEDFFYNRVKREELCQYLGVDSLGYLSLQGLERIRGENIRHACFSGEYPFALNGSEELLMKREYEYVSL